MTYSRGKVTYGEDDSPLAPGILVSRAHQETVKVTQVGEENHDRELPDAGR
jgi:hypothetical protein